MLLASKEFRGLCGEFEVCLAGALVPRDWDIRFPEHSHILVFNAKGELVAAARLDRMLNRPDFRNRSVAEAVQVFVRVGLTQESMEEFIREYVSNQGSADAYSRLRWKVGAMDRVGALRVAEQLEQLAADDTDPGRRRVHALSLRADALGHQPVDLQALGDLARQIEEALAAHPQHALEAQLLDVYVDVAHRFTFDLPAACTTVATQLEASFPQDEAAAAAARRAAEELRATCTGRVESLGAQAADARRSDFTRLRALALLGRAAEFLAALAEQPVVPDELEVVVDGWRREAEARVAVAETSDE